MRIEKLIRENIKNLVPYSSARNEFKGQASVFLDANENPYNSSFNRYPDPLHKELRDVVSEVFYLNTEKIFIGNGSDEVIDLLLRMCCRPSIDNIIICPPTYGMYEVSAHVNDVNVIKVPQNADFTINIAAISKALNANTKMIFICSPNNPTGNLVPIEIIEYLLKTFNIFVVIDEAYIDFSEGGSSLSLIENYDNLIIMRTLSKAWGIAGLRVGIALADERVIKILYKIKLPYNVNIFSQKKALEILKNKNKIIRLKRCILNERKFVIKELSKLTHIITHIYPSDANFILVKTINAKNIYNFLKNRNIIVRDRSSNLHCENCIRITIGTKKENRNLIDSLKEFF
ncbi:MAG: histidinol-phosphate transaminase [Bacteroidetes bacterium GWE2_29_8]|nr:MAG: histidinol-phosphate transaminase [Bacteroidetes bacterium GWE2_29_8]OFY23964.1 MAG: histidinol-phosphate transaminase [Bacteroidetes bacterium GWF2_29_10]